MTRTFNTPEELMIALLNREEWYHEHDKSSIIFYNSSDKSVPFKIKVGGIILPITEEYKYCDGKTLWTKVKEKTELDLIKEKYTTGDYVCIYKILK